MRSKDREGPPRLSKPWASRGHGLSASGRPGAGGPRSHKLPKCAAVVLSCHRLPVPYRGPRGGSRGPASRGHSATVHCHSCDLWSHGRVSLGCSRHPSSVSAKLCPPKFIG